MRSKFGHFAAVLAIVVVGMLLGGTSIATAHGTHGKGKTLKLVGTTIQEEFLDLGTPGPSLGDQFILSQTLTKKGNEVGTSGVVCTITQVTPPYDVLTFQCIATLSLDKGQITLQGLIEVQGEDDPGPFVVAITGGTGKFRGASGEAVVRDVSETMTVYKLKFDSHKKKKHHHR